MRRGTEFFKLGHFAAASPQAVDAANWDFESMALAFWATHLLSEMCCKAHLRFLNVCRVMIMNNVG